MLPLLIFFPFLAAPLSYLIGKRSRDYRNFFVIAATAVALAFALAVWHMESGESCVTSLAGGLSFRADGFRGLYAAVIALMWFMTSLFSREYFSEHYRNRNRYYFFLLLTLGASFGVFLSADFLTAFVFFEILSFTSFVWVIQDETPAADRAAKTYLAVAVVGGLVLFMGIALLYHRFGTLDFIALRELAEKLPDKKELYPAGLCILFGFGAKAGLFPLHVWLPKAHPVAPAPASALLSGALTKIGIYGVTCVTASLFAGDARWGSMLFLIAMVTLFLGALMAILSNNLKKILACSSMSQIGFVTVGVALAAALGREGDLAAAGAVWHMMNHSILKLTLFMAAGAVYMNLHALSLDEIRGFGRKKPLLGAAFLFGGLGLGGIPLWNGYLSKTMLHEAITEFASATGSFWVHAAEWIFMLTGGLTLAYMTKIFVCLFLEKPSDAVKKAEKRRYMSFLSALALGISAAMIPVMGLPRVMRWFLRDAVFFAGGNEVPSPAFFSPEALSGALVTLLAASAAYLLLVWLPHRKAGGYRDLWPKALDLEEKLYRPALLRILPGIFGPVMSLFARVPDRIFGALPRLFEKPVKAAASAPDKVWSALPLIGGVCARVLSDLPDEAILAARKTALREKKPRLYFHRGTLLSETAGKMAERVAHRPGFVTAFGRAAMRLREEFGEVGASFSFALLLAAMGLCVMLIGLLLFR